VEIARFKATDFGTLFDGTAARAWEDWLPVNAAFPVRGKSVSSQLSSVPACQRIVKKAIAERLLRAHATDVLPETGPQFTVQVALLRDEVSLTLDSSGLGLHKRGYRDRSGAAPLKETLAAGLVLLSFWDDARPFIDPFCGTGTICIEAAMIARRLAPGLKRRFAAEQWPRLGPDLWHEARHEAESLVRRDVNLLISGFDHDRTVLELAGHHAARAGVATDITFLCRPFADLRTDLQYGCVITNPPYGERLGETDLTGTDNAGDPWRRVVVEKPFGRDLESARALDADLHRSLSEDQIYRIDHYLGKETVQNILMFRFANTVFEPVWTRDYVDHVQITVAESIGVGQRAGYFDRAGLLRDMFQNHILQLLALVAMEPPASFAADRVRDEKVKLLRSILPLTPEQVSQLLAKGLWRDRGSRCPQEGARPARQLVLHHFQDVIGRHGHLQIS